MGSQDNDLIFQEVEEDLQRERMNALWKTYGPYVIGVAVAIVLIVAGREGWNAYDASVRADEGGKYEAASRLSVGENADLSAAIAGFAALAEESGSGYKVLANLRQAALLVEQGEVEQAVAIYDKLIADSGIEERYRDFALLLSVLQQADSLSPDAALQKIQPLAAKAGPWRFFARELGAVFANAAGDKDTAKAEFSALADDPSAPAGVRARAAEFLKTLGA